MMNFIRKYWWLAILLILLPFALNIIIKSNTPAWITCIFGEDVIVGEPKDWLTFWGSYISGAATIIVIVITLKNQEELKKLQLNTIKYESHKEFVNDLIDEIKNINKINNTFKLKPIFAVNDNDLDARCSELINESCNTREWFSAKYRLEIRNNRSIFREYMNVLNQTHSTLIEPLNKICQICYLNLPESIEHSLLIKTIEDRISLTQDRIENLTEATTRNLDYFTELLNRYNNVVDVNSDVVFYHEGLANKLIGEQLSLIEKTYWPQTLDLLSEGSKLIRIEKEKIYAIFKQDEPIKSKNKDDLPF